MKRKHHNLIRGVTIVDNYAKEMEQLLLTLAKEKNQFVILQIKECDTVVYVSDMYAKILHEYRIEFDPETENIVIDNQQLATTDVQGGFELIQSLIEKHNKFEENKTFIEGLTREGFEYLPDKFNFQHENRNKYFNEVFSHAFRVEKDNQGEWDIFIGHEYLMEKSNKPSMVHEQITKYYPLYEVKYLSRYYQHYIKTAEQIEQFAIHTQQRNNQLLKDIYQLEDE